MELKKTAKHDLNTETLQEKNYKGNRKNKIKKLKDEPHKEKP